MIKFKNLILFFSNFDRNFALNIQIQKIKKNHLKL